MDGLLTTHMMTVRYGVTARALRFYEEKGMLTPVRDGLKRLYDSHERFKLDLIQQGINLGFSLREIRDVISKIKYRPDGTKSIVSAMNATAISAHIAALEAKRMSIDRSIASIKTAMVA